MLGGIATRLLALGVPEESLDALVGEGHPAQITALDWATRRVEALLPEGAGASDLCPLPMGELRWPCSRFVLVRSQLTATGSEYRIIGEFPLHGESHE